MFLVVPCLIKENELKELIGKRVEAVWVSPDHWFLTFTTAQGNVSYITDADCCSDTWFADILGMDNLLGEEVLGAEELDLPGDCVEDGRSRQDCDRVYGWQLATQKGKTEIMFRNSSNGYYGGRIALYTGELPEDMQEIRSDWRA